MAWSRVRVASYSTTATHPSDTAPSAAPHAGGLLEQSWEAQLLELERHLNASTAEWKVGGPSAGSRPVTAARAGAPPECIRLKAPAAEGKAGALPCASPLRCCVFSPLLLAALRLPAPWKVHPIPWHAAAPALSLAPPSALQLAVGHHPTYSNGDHGNNQDLIDHLEPLFWRYNVSAYFVGEQTSVRPSLLAGVAETEDGVRVVQEQREKLSAAALPTRPASQATTTTWSSCQCPPPMAQPAATQWW